MYQFWQENFGTTKLDALARIEAQKKTLKLASKMIKADNGIFTLKGAVVILTLYLFNQAGVDFSETDVAVLIEAVAIITGSLWTVFGFVRKLYYK